jgi:formylglycine-generating enzyme required for sulfatase activity
MIKKTIIFILCLTGFGQIGFASDYKNFIGMEFVNIPSGIFFMGSCSPEKGKIKSKGLFGLGAKSACPSGGQTDSNTEKDEEPQHKIEISKTFQMGTYEVTRAQYETFLKSEKKTVTVSYTKHNLHGDQAAVVWVSLYQAQAFMDWLNLKKPAEDKGRYRLPTEAEWEYAARAGTRDPYFFGSKRFEITRFAWIIKDSQSFGAVWSQAVGKKQPNPWGLYDIYGNVWEWTADVYQKDYYSKSPTIDPKGPTTGQLQVVRGCSLYTSARNCRSAKRHFLSADKRDGTVGFRIVRELP